MAERFTADLAFIVFVLLVAALLGFLIGYLLRKNRKCPKCAELEEENASLNLRIKKFGEETDSLNLQIKNLETENTKLRLEAENLLSGKTFTFDHAKAREVFGSKIIENDLKIVEGIGPKISEILINRGIKTWKSLSETPSGLIKEYLLTDGGPRYRIHFPETWPEQAKLAHEGQWQELKAFQEKLLGGKLVS